MNPFCAECGGEVLEPASASFCRVCGADLRNFKDEWAANAVTGGELKAADRRAGPASAEVRRGAAGDEDGGDDGDGHDGEEDDDGADHPHPLSWKPIIVLSVIGVLALFGLIRWSHQLLSSPDSETVRLHGAKALGRELMLDLAKRFLTEQGIPADKIEVDRATPDKLRVSGPVSDGSSNLALEILLNDSNTAMQNLVTHKCQLGISWGSFKPPAGTSTASVGVNDIIGSHLESKLAQDRIVVIVNEDNPLRSIDIKDVARIFAGVITDWDKVKGNDGEQRLSGPINVFIPSERTEVYKAFKADLQRELDLDPQDLTIKGNRPDENQQANEYQQVSAHVQSDRYAIGFVNLPNVARRARPIKVTRKGANAGEEEEVAAFSRPVFIYKLENSGSFANKFVEFAVNGTGQEVFESKKIALSKETPSLPLPDDPVDYGTLKKEKGARMLGSCLFQSEHHNLDGRALAAISAAAAALGGQSEVNLRNLFVFGFADEAGDDGLNQALSEKRAQAVADELRRLNVNVAPANVMGYGAKFPVEPDTRKKDSPRDRRVEIWLRR